jgi:YesN/AraC family two-component response regulator
MDDYLAKPCAKQSLEDMLLKWENIVLGPLDEHSSSRNEEPSSQVEQTTQQQVKKETDNEVLRLPPREEP